MQPIKVRNIPYVLLERLQPIKTITFPRQGYTSNVGIVESSEGRFALKCSREKLYRTWLKREANVLESLQNKTNFLIPKLIQFTETTDASWILMECLEGETLRSALLNEENENKRQELIYEFGKVLAQIHATPCPNNLTYSRPWLDEMLHRAHDNFTHYKVDGTEQTLKRIQSERPEPHKQTFIHGDFTIDNVLVSKGRVTGVIDWSDGAFGDPRYDMAIAIRPKPNAFELAKDKQIFFEGYGTEIISEVDYEYFENGLYAFF
ncbi:Aminoglycoside 3'-phosphotransferase [Sutcliffiella rhizosphaerae]|uniref:Aminoglycoside 3'-phosphotransferase n=1 Tax=Sutcliffiella rhizosphaerae TaxID=2880967 RepID=A0ABM8YNQ0_9BACI|nr:Aminoglycoside 3'-phosphotransferase [Sutcliffiella rhizosphaerae]